MGTFRSVVWSSVGKKFISGFTGLALLSFVLVHLLGNLTLFMEGEAFNSYAHFLEGLVHGWAVYAAEAGLLILFVLHISAGISVTLDKWKARPEGYQKTADLGGASRKTFSSRTMIWTGLILLVFVPVHVIMFKFGAAGTIVAGEGAGHGETMKDLFGLVALDFTKPAVAFGYLAVMLLLGFHLKHGIWSAFQSLGLNSRAATPLLCTAGAALAVLIAAGFVLFPLYFYFVH
jgi:succinate dehydrogenase / fumarate reductase, cytochrome b subunit